MVFVIRLPEEVRKTLQRVVNELRNREGVCGIGLFGSWSRGDAEISSDVDLLILSKQDFDHEYVERIEKNGLLIDLNLVPKSRILGMIPAEMDQKLYEMQILYDRDWSLTNAKLVMTKSYRSIERIDLRTEAHIVDSDIYLSRATSALSREDDRSAYLFACMSMEKILRILVEALSEPFSNSHAIERYEDSAARLGMQVLFEEYVQTAMLCDIDAANAKNRLRLFKKIWDEIGATVKNNLKELNQSHFLVRTRLNYYLNPAFLEGAVLRSNFLIDSVRVAEAVHYMSLILLQIIEGYIWFWSSVSRSRTDSAILVRSLETLEEKNPGNFGRTMEFLNLCDIGKLDVVDAIEKARRMNVHIRRDRRILIKKAYSGDFS